MATIMIVDDAVFMRKMLADIFIKNGHEVIAEGENAKQSIDMYKKLKPDLVTLDIIMPEVDNIDAIGAIKEIIKVDPKANILMVSSMGQQEIIIECINAGARDFIVKPFQEANIANAVKRLVGK